MKVLWLCCNESPYYYKKGLNRDTDGSWMEPLMKEIEKNHSDIQLSVAFMGHIDSEIDDTIGKIDFFSVQIKKVHKLTGQWERLLHKRYQYILNKVKPDIIHVFGSETELGLIYKDTDIPIVLHIQGLLTIYQDFWYPRQTSKTHEILRKIYNPMAVVKMLFSRRRMNIALRNEQDMFRRIKFFMGRTEWDRASAKVLSKDAEYFYCSEALRENFEHATGRWEWNAERPVRVVSVISDAIYKGQDVILRAAYYLKNVYQIDFEWHIIGIGDMSIGERLSGIKARDVNAVPQGRHFSDYLLEEMLNGSVFVHPSYIENSSNAVCEAQITGIPVIATCVGGTQSLIRHEEDGILVPSNDPALIAHYVMRFVKEKDFAARIGHHGSETAARRHNTKEIANRVCEIYHEILTTR